MKIRSIRIVYALAACLLALAVSAPARAQTPSDWSPSGLELTRKDLSDLLAKYEQAAQSDAYSSSLRAQAARDAALIRQRLKEGDFHVGDRIYLSVQGEEALTDTFTVAGGSVIRLPVIGDISLQGVLRSELEDYLTNQLARFIKEPRVSTQSLMRVAVLGQVGRPGFYVLPSTTLITEALMAAGGPRDDAKIDDLKIERADDVIWDGEPLQTAMTQGRTLDQMNLQAGDQIVIPKKGSRLGSIARWAGLTVIPPLVYILIRGF